MSQLRYVDTNHGHHKQVVYNNFLYWWFVDNKTSSRYICCKKSNNKCKGSITIANDQVIRESNNHNHLGICNSEIEVLCGKQDLKQEVETDLSRMPNELYKNKQADLQTMVPDDILRKFLPTFKEIRSTLAKRRAKHLRKIQTQFD